MITSGQSGHDIYCLSKSGLHPGELLVGNSVYSIGFFGNFMSNLRMMLGGEVPNVTSMISEGRHLAIGRMIEEGKRNHAYGITGVKTDLIQHNDTGNIEFLGIGSAVHSSNPAEDILTFSGSASGQDLYCMLDSGYSPTGFAFGDIAYALGIGQNLIASFKQLVRGEIKEYSDIFNRTRHTALERIVSEAKSYNANAVLGITTKVIPYSLNVSEMLMTGTASYNPDLPAEFSQNPITSDLTASELWSISNQGMIPLKLVLGTSVYSLGVTGSITSFFKSFVRGEINEVTTLIYEAREHAIGLIAKEAESIGADRVIGVKTYIYQLGNGLIEFLAIGTAVKKVPFAKTKSENIIPQAIIEDKETYLDSPIFDFGFSQRM